MNTLMEIRANIYTSDVDPRTMKANPLMELVVIYSKGKTYFVTEEGKVAPIPQIEDVRFLVNPKELDEIIERLTDWKKTMDNRKEFWDQILPGIEDPPTPA